ncbi:hypothetical protein BHM03_00036405 [Ensete ventricosum]|nr:hypothetical protein BHM03_00036405 [Ensete ventricosum]
MEKLQSRESSLTSKVDTDPFRSSHHLQHRPWVERKGSVGSTRPGDVRKCKGNRVREEKRKKRIVVGKASTKEGRRGGQKRRMITT